MSKRKWTKEAALQEGRRYTSRSEFAKGNGSAYEAARENGWLDLLYPRKQKDWSSDAAVLAEGRKYASRKEFQNGSTTAYQAALRRGLLDKLYPNFARKWSSDAAVLAEGRKYASRKEFRDGSQQAYKAACKRKLLDLIGFPENNARCDNDAIYIWRAIGQHYNGNPVYKIGVTSARLGTVRVEQVARWSGFKFDLICCEKVQGDALELERKLHLLGEDPRFVGFNGCTEFRALSDSALYAAISMICNQL